MEESPRKRLFGGDKSTGEILENMYQQMAEWRADYRRKLDSKADQVATLRSTLEAKDLEIKQLKFDVESSVKVLESQKELFRDKTKSLDILMNQQKEQLSEVIHTNETLNSKLSSLRHEYSSKLDTSTSRILELESVLSLAKVEAETRLKEITRLSGSLVSEQNRFKEILGDFCTKIAMDLPPDKYSSYEVKISMLTSGRNKLEANIFDLLRINGNSSLLTQETEELFTTVNELNNTIKLLKNKNRSKIKKMMDQHNSNEEQHRSLKAELSETLHRLEISRLDFNSSQKLLQDKEKHCKDMASELTSCRSQLVEQETKLDNLSSHLEELKRELWKYQQLHIQSTEELVNSEEAIQKVQASWKASEYERNELERNHQEASKRSMQRIEELEQSLRKALEDEKAVKQWEIKLSDQQKIFDDLKAKYDDVVLRHSNGIQELKNIQFKLQSAHQSKEETELRLKDADLRNNLLLSDFSELRKQKEEGEADLQGRIASLTEEMEELNNVMKNKALKSKATSLKVTELEKVIADMRAEWGSQQSALEAEISRLREELTESQRTSEICMAELEVSKRSLLSLEDRLGVVQKDLADSKVVSVEKEKGAERLQYLLEKAEQQLNQAKLQRTNDMEELQRNLSITESKLKLTQSLLQQEQDKGMEQERCFREQERKLKESMSQIVASKEDLEYKLQAVERTMAKKQEAHQLELEEAHLKSKGFDEKRRKSELVVTELQSSLQDVNFKYNELITQLSSSCQETKSLQSKLQSVQQSNEELVHCFKDAELRNSLLLSDLTELRKQKEEVETDLQGRIASLTEEMEELNNAMKNKALKLKATSLKVTELEKVIADMRAEWGSQQSALEAEISRLREELTESQRKMESYHTDLDGARMSVENLSKRCQHQSTELNDVYNLISEKDAKLSRLAQSLNTLQVERDQLQMQYEKESRDTKRYHLDSESKLQQLQFLLDSEQARIREQETLLTGIENKYHQTIKDLHSAKEELSKTLQLLAAHVEQNNMLNSTVSDQQKSLETAKMKFDDLVQRHSNGIQELKNLQTKLKSTQQSKEETELRLKDAELRNNLLLSDFSELRKRKEEGEAELQGRIASLTGNIEVVQLSMSSLNLNINTLVVEKTEQLKTINTLHSRLEKKEAELLACSERYSAEKDQLKQLLTKVSWKTSSFCEHVEKCMGKFLKKNGSNESVSATQTPESTPKKSKTPSKLSPHKSPSQGNVSNIIVDVESLVRRVDELTIQCGEAFSWIGAEQKRLLTEQGLFKQEIESLRETNQSNLFDKNELSLLKLAHKENIKVVEDLQRRVEAEKALANEAKVSLLKLQEDYEHAETIVTKQKQALEGANEVLKKQRLDLDDLHNVLQQKKQDQGEMNKVITSQQDKLAEFKRNIDHLNMLVHSLRSDKKCLEVELQEYQEALTTVIQRFQKEFGSLQSQLADITQLSF